MRRSTILLIATVGFAVLFVGSGLVLGTPPDAEDDGAAVVAWFADHQSNVQWWLWFGTLALLLFGVFAALVRRTLPAVHRDVFFFGAIALAATTAVQSWFWGGLSWHPEQLEPSTARTVLDVASYWGPILISATVVMLAPVVVLGLQRDAVLPRWLGWLAAIAVAEQLIETVTIFGDEGFIAPGGPMNLLLGAFLVTATFVALGVVTARSPDLEDA